MKKDLIRLTALLIIPCLFADPVIARNFSAFSQDTFHQTPQVPLPVEQLYEQQALSAMALWHRLTVPFSHLAASLRHIIGDAIAAYYLHRNATVLIDRAAAPERQPSVLTGEIVDTIERLYQRTYDALSASYEFPTVPEYRQTEMGLFSPSPIRALTPLLRTAGVGPGTNFVDAGGGDGRVAFVARAALGAEAMSIEGNGRLDALAHDIQKQLVPSLQPIGDVHLIHGLIQEQDLSTADVVYYTLNEPPGDDPEESAPLNEKSNFRKIERQLAEQLQPGAIVILTFMGKSNAMFEDLRLKRFDVTLHSPLHPSDEALLRPQFYRRTALNSRTGAKIIAVISFALAFCSPAFALTTVSTTNPPLTFSELLAGGFAGVLGVMFFSSRQSAHILFYLTKHPHPSSNDWAATRQWWIENRNALRDRLNLPRLRLIEVARLVSSRTRNRHFLPLPEIAEKGSTLDLLLDHEELFSSALQEALVKLQQTQFKTTQWSELIAGIETQLRTGILGKTSIPRNPKFRNLLEELIRIPYGKAILDQWRSALYILRDDMTDFEWEDPLVHGFAPIGLWMVHNGQIGPSEALVLMAFGIVTAWVFRHRMLRNASRRLRTAA